MKRKARYEVPDNGLYRFPRHVSFCPENSFPSSASWIFTIVNNVGTYERYASCKTEWDSSNDRFERRFS